MVRASRLYIAQATARSTKNLRHSRASDKAALVLCAALVTFPYQSVFS
jgi:hypothetical protein